MNIFYRKPHEHYEPLIRNLVTISLCLLLITAPVFAEHEFSLRAAPIIEVPVNIPEFSTGLGASLSLDWVFWQKKDFSLGVSAGGAFSSLPFETGDPLVLMSGKAGPFLRYRPFDRWAFRVSANGGGYQYFRDDQSGNNLLLSSILGFEFYISPYISLYSEGEFSHRIFSSEPLNTFIASAGFRFNLSEIIGGKTRVRVDITEQYRVFPVSWAWYEHNPVATVRFTNDEPNAITDIELSFFMERYMSQPYVFSQVPYLASGEHIDVPVTALFNEAMMSLTETVNANGLMNIQYHSLGARKEAVSPIQMPIFHRNTLSWDDDRRAAAFVSPYDFAALYFARYVNSAVNNAQLTGNTPSNVVKAAALFEALRLYGISYVVVPATSFARVTTDESVLDNVSYPYQALYYRGGDCSYLSILFCSMLEALNVETAFITIPGHIYIAFEVADTNWLARNADIIELDGKRWFPVEVTVPGEGFTRAWRVGARQWRTNRSNAVLYPIRDAWKIYPSVTVPSSGDNLPDMPEWDAIIRALQRELGNIR